MRDLSRFTGQGPEEPPPGQRLEEAGSRASEAAGEAGQQARGAGEEMGRGLERVRLAVADGLSRVANTLRGSTTEADSTARRFADSLQQGASYLRQKDLGSMRRDLEGLIKQYPAQALGAAFVVGLVLGRRMRRR